MIQPRLMHKDSAAGIQPRAFPPKHRQHHTPVAQTVSATVRGSSQRPPAEKAMGISTKGEERAR
jgi:hypothetical protein